MHTLFALRSKVIFMKNNLDYKYAFIENEKTANQYAASCMRIMAFVVAVIWLLNLIGIFVVPADIMGIASAGSLLLFFLPTLLCHLSPLDSPKLKYCILGCFILGITLLSSAMPKHAILAWMAPLVLSCHYYSKKFSYGVVSVSIICMAISLFIGLYWGEWDNNLLRAIEIEGAIREVTPLVIKNMVIFYLLPRAMILIGTSVICTTLASRTRHLLEQQIQNDMEKQQIESELNVATLIQTSMLPSIFPSFARRREFDIFASMNPARKSAAIFMIFSWWMIIIWPWSLPMYPAKACQQRYSW